MAILGTLIEDAASVPKLIELRVTPSLVQVKPQTALITNRTTVVGRAIGVRKLVFDQRPGGWCRGRERGRHDTQALTVSLAVINP